MHDDGGDCRDCERQLRQITAGTDRPSRKAAVVIVGRDDEAKDDLKVLVDHAAKVAAQVSRAVAAASLPVRILVPWLEDEYIADLYGIGSCKAAHLSDGAQCVEAASRQVPRELRPVHVEGVGLVVDDREEGLALIIDQIDEGEGGRPGRRRGRQRGRRGWHGAQDPADLTHLWVSSAPLRCVKKAPRRIARNRALYACPTGHPATEPLPGNAFARLVVAPLEALLLGRCRWR